ncbi:MAG TPA: putative quinol monooxygenase [Mesorhizobium sp.]|jgi:quinol monooxygenase YgiN|uniref:putative quinol monooxygenase n=1 Tax=Mesorhizobium sp. TaxID=1871066 RepID=UPI002DDD01B9|nr:putative quinol monooxygenase [Mesorhizobium sp.]HEV2503488.1 putative quinol monooxygenase [Mesorhizobium sp.]
MLKVVAHDFIKLEAIENVRPLYAELVEKTRREPLCISYELFIDQKNPGHFVFVEEWPDRSALRAHVETEHFQRLVPLINAHKARDGTVVLLDPFAA